MNATPCERQEDVTAPHAPSVTTGECGSTVAPRKDPKELAQSHGLFCRVAVQYARRPEYAHILPEIFEAARDAATWGRRALAAGAPRPWRKKARRGVATRGRRPKSAPPDPVTVCAHCGDPIEPKPGKRFCHPRCRMAAWEAENRKGEVKRRKRRKEC